jgi:hypothetical protein
MSLKLPAPLILFILLTNCINAASDQTTPKSNPITQAAVQAGILTCTSRINQVSNFLTANTINGAFLFIPANAPDQHIFSTSLEVIPSNKNSMYASASFSPMPGGGCDAVYDTVDFMQEECPDVAVKQFKVYGTPGVLKKNIILLNAGNARFYLMPAGRKGCVIIKKEVVQ